MMGQSTLHLDSTQGIPNKPSINHNAADCATSDDMSGFLELEATG